MIEARYESVTHGIHIRHGVCSAPSGHHEAIAYRTYQAGVTPWATVLVVPGAFETGALYHPLAFWLAEQGMRVILFHLGEHGTAGWYSFAGGHLEALHLTDELWHLSLVLQQREDVGAPLILAGSGLGGVLAQLAALSHPRVAALALFGTSTPEQAGETWAALLTPRVRRWPWRTRHEWKPLARLWPPAQQHLRSIWLPATTSDYGLFAVWHLLGEESPHLAADAAALAHQSPLARLPALVCVGAQDPFVSLSTAWATARAYNTGHLLLPHAAHLLLTGPAWLESAKRLLDFSRQVSHAYRTDLLERSGL